MIGASERLERLAHVLHPGTKTAQHCAYDGIALEKDPIGLDLRGQMTIADVPGNLGERRAAARAHLHQILLGSDNLHVTAIIEKQTITVREHDCLRQIDQHIPAVAQGDDAPPQMTLSVRESDDVQGNLLLFPRRPVGAQHGRPQKRK